MGVSIELKRLQKDAKSSIIDIEIDELTECLRERKTGKLVDTVYHLASKDDIDQSKQWRKIKSDSFDWDAQKKKSEKVFSLKLENSDIVEGFLGITYKPQDYAVFIDLVESNPKNIGRNGEFEGVGPHLFAMAIKEAKSKGFDAVYFTPKTALIDHYSKTLGAIMYGSNMIIEGYKFEYLYNKYYGGKNEK